MAGIQGVAVHRADESKQAKIHRVQVRLGDGLRIEVTDVGRHTTVRLEGRRAAVALAARGSGCDFDRAINILRLRMPKARC